MAEYDDTLFRTQFPEYGDTTMYPEVIVSMYWDMASNFIDPTGPSASNDTSCPSACLCALQRMLLNGNSLALALNFLTAHLLSLATPVPPVGVAANPSQGGFETGARIGDISVQKLAPPVNDAWDYWLVQTPYGQALAALLKVVSVGGLSVGCIPERHGFRKYGGIFL
jgi:Protein of unknown function (DUF4054)